MALGATFKSSIHSTSQATSYTTTTSFTPTANVLLLAFVGVSAADNSETPGFTGNGLTWTRIATMAPTAAIRLNIWAALTGSSPSNGAQTVGTYGTNRTGGHITVIEVSGADLRLALSVAAGSLFPQAPTASAASGTTGTVTLAAAANSANRPFAMFMHLADEVASERANWTELDDGHFTTPAFAFEVEWRSDTFETTATATWVTSTGGWAGIAIEVADATSSATASPAVVAAVGAAPSATETGQANTTPSAVAAVAAVPAPTLRADAGVSPATVAAVAAVSAPGAVEGDAGAVVASVVARVAAPDPTLRGDAARAPPSVDAAAAVGDPVSLGDAKVSPDAVVGIADVPVPLFQEDANAQPDTVEAFAAIPTPTAEEVLPPPPIVVAIAAEEGRGARLGPRIVLLAKVGGSVSGSVAITSGMVMLRANERMAARGSRVVNVDDLSGQRPPLRISRSSDDLRRLLAEASR